MVEKTEPIRLIFHVGMGKTGTSSLQQALQLSAKALKAQRTEYLGMWMDFIDPSFQNWTGHAKFIGMSEKECLSTADKFLKILQDKAAQNGTRTFIFSNEGLSHFSKQLSPFLKRLEKNGVDVTILLYVRDPVKWLPSAYSQWRLKHKTYSGPLKSYATGARELVGWYRDALNWHERFPGKTIVRSYDAANNVVEDFADAFSLEIPKPDVRANITETLDQMFLKAFFAAQVEEAYLPDFFDNSIGVSASAAPRITNLVAHAFDLSATSEIIAENEDIFTAYREHFGFDPRAVSADTLPSMPDPEAIRDRLVEVVTSVTLDQSIRIRSLETEVETLRNCLQALLTVYSTKYRRDLDQATELVIGETLDQSLKVRGLESDLGALHEALQTQIASDSAQDRRSWAYRWRAARSWLVARLRKLN